jgi:formylglycine-generating enzyme required for sulfatase activity
MIQFTKSLPGFAALLLLLLGSVDCVRAQNENVETLAEEPSTFQIDFDHPGLTRERPESGRVVEVDGGYMIPYSKRIPGTEIEFEMVPIPGGTFLMGSPEHEESRSGDEGPQIEIAMDRFWMGKYEVTWGEFKNYMSMEDIFQHFQRFRFRKVTEDKAYDAVSAPSEIYDPSWTFDAGAGMNEPCALMTPYCAKQYTKFISRLTDQFFRLPTEAEWEYACRANTTTAFSFGNDPDQLTDYGWFEKNSDEFRHPVGKLKPNPWGLYDMYGNVAEWVLDEYRANTYSDLKEAADRVGIDYVHPTSDYDRVCRGGSFELDAENCRSAARMHSTVEWQDEDPNLPRSPWWLTTEPAVGVGFRIVEPLHPPATEELQNEYWTDTAATERSVLDRIHDSRRGAIGLVDENLPSVIEKFEKIRPRKDP